MKIFRLIPILLGIALIGASLSARAESDFSFEPELQWRDFVRTVKESCVDYCKEQCDFLVGKTGEMASSAWDSVNDWTWSIPQAVTDYYADVTSSLSRNSKAIPDEVVIWIKSLDPRNPKYSTVKSAGRN